MPLPRPGSTFCSWFSLALALVHPSGAAQDTADVSDAGAPPHAALDAHPPALDLPDAATESAPETQPILAPQPESPAPLAEPPALAPAAAPAPAPPAAVEVTVRAQSAADRQRESAEAVKVIETTHARREAADLGEVLARAEGVSVRRAGGLGSSTRLSLNGLTGDQIRFFLDGVPLDLAGYSFGISNVPVGLVDRIDVYRGVVPIRYGADALGGAVELVTDDDLERSHAAASYQIGSFGTQRLSVNGIYAHSPSGFFTRVNGFVDRAANDYLMDVDVADANQRLRPARVHRYNDRYAAQGASAEVGIAGRPGLKLLALRAFVSDYDKGLPHDVFMTTPYGRVRYGMRSYGTSLRLQKRLVKGLQLTGVAGYAQDRRYFDDTSTGIFNWYGQRTGTRTVGGTVTPGEIEPGGFDIHLIQHNGFARAQLAWRFLEGHTLRLALSPTYSARGGEDRQIPDGSRDRLNAQQQLWVMVTGLEHRFETWHARLENILFGKDYVYRARSREQWDEGQENNDADHHRGGVGDALRVRVHEDLYLKASYEWTTRLPRPDEVFGDGMTVNENLDLVPETSHNANLGAAFSHPTRAWGAYRAEATLFLRDADQLIVMLPDRGQSQRFYKYVNVGHARSTGIEGVLGWTSPGDYVWIDGNVTWQDFRNLATTGYAARFEGDPIPNRPWLFANGSARLQLRSAIVANDTLELGWYGRYVHEFFRTWESAGRGSTKATVPSQFTHAVLLTYLVRGARWTFGSTLELDNITNAKVYDFFGVQRPGRAAYYKATLEF